MAVCGRRESPKTLQCFLQPHLARGLLLRRGREVSTGTSKPSVVETYVVQSAGSKASLADVGLMVHERASNRGRGPWRCRLAAIRSSEHGEWPRDRGLELLGEMELALLLKTRASVVLA